MAELLNRPNSVEACLTVFLRDQAGREFRNGERDCGLWLADWVAYYRGIDDPASHLRHHYSDEQSRTALLNGTPFALIIARLARKCGLVVSETPSIGAVGIIIANEQVVGAIMTANGWAVVAPRGIVRLPQGMRIIRAWEVSDARNTSSDDG